MKKILSLLALMCLFCTGAWADVPFRNHRYDTFKSTPIKSNSIVFVGNSITNMHPWVEAFGNDPRIVNRGCSGATSSEILANVRSYCVGQPAKIFLMIGINDNATNSTKQAELANNIMNTVSQIRTISPNTQIYVQSILPCGRSGWPNAETVATCNTLIQELLTQNYGSDDHVMYLDVYTELLGKLNTDNTGVYSFDKLHTTAAGYAIWTDFIKSYVGVNPVYPSEDLTKARQLNGGSGDSWGARATYFSMLPIESEDVLFFGDEMVHGGEWQELLGNPNVKNRGTSWGYEGTNGWMSYTKNDVKATFTAVEGVSKVAPKQVLLYTGTGEVNGSESMSTIVDYYKGIVTDIRNYTNASTKISLVSLMPTTTAGNARVKEFNAAIKAYADATDNVEYIDIYSVLANNDNVNTTYFPASNNYLYGEGYVAVANELAKYIDNTTPVSHEQAKAYRALIDDENADEAYFEEGYYRIQVGEGSAEQHADYKGYYMYSNPHTYNNFNWAVGLTQDASLESTLVYITGSHDQWHIEFNHGKDNPHYTAGNTTYSTTASNLCFIPNSDASEWKIKNAENNQYWIGWNLGGPSVGSGSEDNVTNPRAQCYYKFIKYVEEPAEPEEELSGFCNYKATHIAEAKNGCFVIDAVQQGTNPERNHHFLYDNNGNFATAPTIDANNYDNYVWHVTKNANGTYNFKNVGTAKCLSIGAGSGNGQALTLTENGTEIHFDFASGFAALGNGNNQWYDCGNAGTGTTTWSGGVGGSRRMRVYEALQQPMTYTLQCKSNSRYATYNENANNTDGNHLAAASVTTPGKEQKIVIESAQNGYFMMRIATDESKYVYAINTNNADSNVGVKELADGENGMEDKYLWNIVLNTEGYYNIIPKGGNNGWNKRGTVSVDVIGQWEMNDTNDNRWSIAETEPYVAQFPDKGTYYVTFKGTTTDRKNWLYNDLTQSDGYTIQAQNKGEGNEFIWKVVNNGSRITSLVNGQGQNGIRGRRDQTNYYYTEQLVFEAYGAGFYLRPYNATNMKSGHNCLNVASNNDYKNAAGQECVTSWNTDANGGAGKADNIWQVLTVTDKDFYEVVITDGLTKSEYDYSAASYVTYNGQKAANGGFFAVAKGTTITDADLAAINNPAGKVAVFSVEGNVIRVNYVEPTPINVTYTFTVDGKEIGQVVRQETTNSAPTITDIIPEYVNVVDGMPAKVTEATYTINTSYKASVPFEVDTKFYNMNLTDGLYWIYANNSQTNIKEAKTKSDDQAYIWRVGGDWLNGFTFRNMLGYYIAALSNTPANGNNTSRVTETTELTRFDMEENGTMGYRFKPHGGSNYLAHTSASALNLQFFDYYTRDHVYNSSNMIKFVENTTIVAALQEKVNAAYAKKGEIGYPVDMESLAAYIDDNINAANYDAASAAYDAVLAETNINLPEDGKAYYFVNYQMASSTDKTLTGKKWIMKYNDDHTLGTEVYTDQEPSENNVFICRQVGEKFTFVTKDGYYLRHYSRDHAGALSENYDAEQILAIKKHVKESDYVIPETSEFFGFVALRGKRSGTMTNACIIVNGNTGSYDNTDGMLARYNAVDNQYSTAWRIVEVENPNIVKLTNPNPSGSSSLDGKFVGTFSAPYNVELRNGVKAYTGVLSSNGEAVIFTELGTIVPKNTGVLVYAENASDAISDFAIPAATADIPAIAAEANIFLPTGRTGATLQEGDLILGKGSNGVGFYKVNPAKPNVARNKAYIPAGVLTASIARYAFDFEDGELTEIEAIEVAPAAGNVFDLQGRRVLNAQKGLYIVGGKKVVR